MQSIDKKHIAQHIAIIMDGNGRWAKEKGKLRAFGHEAGAKAVKKIIQAVSKFQIPFLTLYTFSTENWNRPTLEVNTLMSLLVRGLKDQISFLNEYQIQLRSIGDTQALPLSVQKELNKVIEQTQNNKGTILTLALNYGGHQEITQAFINIAKKLESNSLKINQIDSKTIEQHLYTNYLPAVDLLIRTGGEYRISNFLLWQIAYAELYFSPVHWPDFDEEHLQKALLNYQQRERRFGKTSEQIQ